MKKGILFHLQWFRVQKTLLVSKGKTLALGATLALGRAGVKVGQGAVAAVKVGGIAAIVAMRQTAGDVGQYEA